MNRIALIALLGALTGAALFCLNGCFNPFAPYGVQTKFYPKPTCQSFCGGDTGCMEGMCHGDPNTLDY